MMRVSRREFLALSAAGAAVAGPSVPLAAADATASGLSSVTRNVQPIDSAEHGARLAKVQGLMQQHGSGALLIESGSTLEYFTGVRWWRSERTTAALVPAEGPVVVVTPAFEEPSVRETLKVPGDVRPWKEDESPFALLASAWRDHGHGKPLAIEPTTRYFIVERLVAAATPAKPSVVPGDELVRACRMVKSPSEIALMQAANDVTITALRYVHGHIRAGMKAADILAKVVAATGELGGSHEFTLVLLNEASAYPHGSIKPQQVREGSVILIDTGCSVHGYQSDISRSWVFGEISARQRELWNGARSSRSRPRSPASRQGRWTGPSARSTSRKAGAAITGSRGYRTAPAMASAWTYTSRLISSVTTLLRYSQACASRMSRGSTSPENSVFVSRTVGT